MDFQDLEECPICGFNYSRLLSLIVYEIKDEELTGNYLSINPETFSFTFKSTDKLPNYPRPRSAIEFNYSCEGCNGYVIREVNNKGERLKDVDSAMHRQEII